MAHIRSPSIATLRSIYKRSQTLFKHQLWAKTYLGLRDLEQGDEIQLTDVLRIHAQEATHPDDLVRSACQWLFTRRILIPGSRRLKDWARDALAAIEAQSPDVLCVVIDWPDGTGWELLDELERRAIEPATVVVTSASIGASNRRRTARRNAHHDRTDRHPVATDRPGRRSTRTRDADRLNLLALRVSNDDRAADLGLD